MVVSRWELRFGCRTDHPRSNAVREGKSGVRPLGPLFKEQPGTGRSAQRGRKNC